MPKCSTPRSMCHLITPPLLQSHVALGSGPRRYPACSCPGLWLATRARWWEYYLFILFGGIIWPLILLSHCTWWYFGGVRTGVGVLMIFSLLLLLRLLSFVFLFVFSIHRSGSSTFSSNTELIRKAKAACPSQAQAMWKDFDQMHPWDEFFCSWAAVQWVGIHCPCLLCITKKIKNRYTNGHNNKTKHKKTSTN